MKIFHHIYNFLIEFIYRIIKINLPSKKIINAALKIPPPNQLKPSGGEGVQLIRSVPIVIGYVIAYSSDHGLLVTGSNTGLIKVWELESGRELQTLKGHSGAVTSVAIDGAGKKVISGSSDRTIKVWEVESGQLSTTLEGHAQAVGDVAFSMDGKLIFSRSRDNTVRIWRGDSYELVDIIEDQSFINYEDQGLVYHTPSQTLFTLGTNSSVLNQRKLNYEILLKETQVDESIRSTHYTNAKVVLLGDSGVGKSGLALVLNKKQYENTDSTHGRKVWPLTSFEQELENGVKQTREILLWDLAGQPTYRLIHQLHLDEVAIALIVFDGKSETDPFAGVQYWHRALQQSEQAKEKKNNIIKQFLVAARMDRGGVGVSKERMNRLAKELNCEKYFITSAKEGWSITELRETIYDAINWDSIATVVSNKLFQDIKQFLVKEKETGRTLARVADLFDSYLRLNGEQDKDIKAEFETCIGRIESQGLIKRLQFGDLLLLQPELIDTYASALINAAKEEPDEMGSILEDKVKAGDFFIPSDERLQNKSDEQFLLIAMVEDLLKHEIAFRETVEDGVHLVFPLQFKKEKPGLPNPKGKEVIFSFEGAIQNIYTTLAVRLAHSKTFLKKEMWKDAAIYETREGGEYGIHLREIDEGHAELTLFYGGNINDTRKIDFKGYIKTHLIRRALKETVGSRQLFACKECTTPLLDEAVQNRRQRGYDWIICGVCEQKIIISDQEKPINFTTSSAILEMDRVADDKRDKAVAITITDGKKAVNEYDVLFCYNKKDIKSVEEIGTQLKEYSLLPWFDEWDVPPGSTFQEGLTKHIDKIKTAVVFIGQSKSGYWEDKEQEQILMKFVNNNQTIIPIILPSCKKVPVFPPYLQNKRSIDFRKADPDPLSLLIWGITGEKNRKPVSDSIERNPRQYEAEFAEYDEIDLRISESNSNSITSSSNQIEPTVEETEMSRINFLHITDLHQGMKGQAHLFGNVQERFYEDLERLHKKSGAWDLVLFTGDLTQKGIKEEFDDLEETLNDLWKKLAELGSHPKLLTVPGNHDLQRPNSKSSAYKAFATWHNDEEVREDFWNDRDCEYRQMVETAFAEYQSWLNRTTIPLLSQTRGILPGDFAATFEKDGIKLAIVGLNSTFLQLGSGDYEGKLDLSVKQLNEVCNMKAPKWIKDHHAAILMTHQPTTWLSPEAKKHFSSEIAPAGRFHMHLFGHMHESNMTSMSIGGGAIERQLQGASLFGMESWGDGRLERIHGYSAGAIEITTDQSLIKIWPRKAVNNKAGLIDIWRESHKI